MSADGDKEEILQRLSESLGRLNQLLCSDLEARGDITGRDRFIVQAIDHCVTDVIRMQRLVDEEDSAA